MKINFNGITREMTPEEEAQFAQQMAEMPKPEPTEDEWKLGIEAALIELAAMMAGGGL